MPAFTHILKVYAFCPLLVKYQHADFICYSPHYSVYWIQLLPMQKGLTYHMEQFELICPMSFWTGGCVKTGNFGSLDTKFRKSKMEKSLFLVMHKPSAALIYFYVQQSEFCLKLEAFMPQHLMSCLNRQRHFRGNIISRKMVVSG